MADESNTYVVKVLKETLQSQKFDPKSFYGRPLKLSEAFCLLWQDHKTGDVSGRQLGSLVVGMAGAAVILDLIALGKIRVDIEKKSLLGIKYSNLHVQVINSTMTGIYLDDALFTSMMEHADKNPHKPKSVEEWIYKASCAQPNCATVTLENLVNQDILGKRTSRFNVYYPTVKSGPQDELKEEIRNIGLRSQAADSYMWTLLKLARAVDNCCIQKGPLLGQWFDSSEYKVAKEAISALVKPAKSDLPEAALELKGSEGQSSTFI